MFWKSLIPFSFIAALNISEANATVCDYRPSELVGAAYSTSVVAISSATAAVGVGAQAAGFYTLTHSVSGATMLGSTLAGSSAAGTVGIIAGTGSGIGAVVAVVTAPITITAAAITAVGSGAFEGACYFTDERVTDYDDVLVIMENMAANADPNHFRLLLPSDALLETNEPIILVRNPVDETVGRFLVKDLYIVEGLLMNRDWFLNTEIGQVGFQVAEIEIDG